MCILMSKISVLMSVYNEDCNDICKSILSVLSQTETDFEFIIVNDNPKKEEYNALLEEWANKDKRIIILNNKENIGLAASMNIALQYANGEYIARMDADDYSVPERFEKELHALDESGNDAVFSNYTLIGPNDEFLDDGKPACYVQEGQDLVEQIVFNGVVHHPTVMMKKEALLRVNGYRLFPCSQDQDLWIRMLESGTKFIFLDEILLHYRVRENSITQKKGLQQYATILYILQLLKERSQSGKDSYSEETYKQYISRKCNDQEEAKRFNKATHCLVESKEAAEKGNVLKYIMLRIKSFCISKTMREYFCFKLRNKKRLIDYING